MSFSKKLNAVNLFTFICLRFWIERKFITFWFLRSSCHILWGGWWGGGGYFLGISTLKQTLTLVILPCEILSKSDLIYQRKIKVANSENWAVSMHLPIKLFAFCIKDVRNIFRGLWSKPFTTFINNVLLSEKPGKKFPWRKSLSIAFVIILSFK